jgi:serine/threonine protein kinase
LKKLTEENLTRQPEEVFDILCKLGEGSYGSVFQAIHKDSQQILAIKQVPVDTDLQEIIKEISIMQQCDSPYVVKYYGSYFKNTDLWVNKLQYTLFKHHLLNQRVLNRWSKLSEQKLRFFSKVKIKKKKVGLAVIIYY